VSTIVRITFDDLLTATEPDQHVILHHIYPVAACHDHRWQEDWTSVVPASVCSPLGLPHHRRCMESNLDHTARHQTHPGLLGSRLLSLLRLSHQCMVYTMYVTLEDLGAAYADCYEQSRARRDTPLSI
jgi:hypothetical protein